MIRFIHSPGPALVGAGAALVGLVAALLAGSWLAAAWAAVATVYALALAHQVRARSLEAKRTADLHEYDLEQKRVELALAEGRVERGQQCVHFVGGPLDGGLTIVPLDRDLRSSVLEVEGSVYRVAAVLGTHFEAELSPEEPS